MIVRGAFTQLLKPEFVKDLQKALWTPVAPKGYVAMGKLYVPHSMQFAFAPPLIYPSFPYSVWVDQNSAKYVEEAERMALIHPDTSEVPIWRRRPERSEHPIRAYRAWGVEVMKDYSPVTDKPTVEAYLKSVTMQDRWEGPVMRAHMKPVDPAVWDKDKSQLDETFRLAGIYAFKERTDAKGLGFPCWGEIALWGRIAQFELGYRAEVCMIKKLWLSRRATRINNSLIYDWSRRATMDVPIKAIQDALSRRYQCDVELTEEELDDGGY